MNNKKSTEGENDVHRCRPPKLARMITNPTTTQPKRGAFILLEGVDRCGKTTQVSLLVKHLLSLSLATVAYRFPDRSTQGTQIVGHESLPSQAPMCCYCISNATPATHILHLYRHTTHSRQPNQQLPHLLHPHRPPRRPRHPPPLLRQSMGGIHLPRPHPRQRNQHRMRSICLQRGSIYECQGRRRSGEYERG